MRLSLGRLHGDCRSVVVAVGTPSPPSDGDSSPFQTHRSTALAAASDDFLVKLCVVGGGGVV